jgi:hypothetical protein
MEQFWAVLLRLADRRECSRSESFHSVDEQARPVYYGVVFEAKREVPDLRLPNSKVGRS